MAKVRVKGDQVMFHCPGCKHAHSVPFPRWSFNGDLEKPTISPSLRIFTHAVDEPDFKVPEQTLCHVVVTDGVLNYCADSGHELRGQAVPMVDWSDNDG